MQKIRPDLDIGYNIKKLRDAKKMSQDDVVRELTLMDLDMSRSTYAKIETNRMNIKISELKAFTIIFDVDYNELFLGI